MKFNRFVLNEIFPEASLFSRKLDTLEVVYYGSEQGFNHLKMVLFTIEFQYEVSIQEFQRFCFLIVAFVCEPCDTNLLP